MKKLILFAVIAFIFVGCGRKEDATTSIDISTAEGQRDSLMSLVAEISTNISELARLESIVHSQNFKDGQKQEVLTDISDKGGIVGTANAVGRAWKVDAEV